MTTEFSEAQFIEDCLKKYLALINESPMLLSLLYDVNLMPEQIRTTGDLNRLVVICELFKMVPPDEIERRSTGKAFSQNSVTVT